MGDHSERLDRPYLATVNPEFSDNEKFAKATAEKNMCRVCRGPVEIEVTHDIARSGLWIKIWKWRCLGEVNITVPRLVAEQDAMCPMEGDWIEHLAPLAKPNH